jgi:hypothetical protein
MGRAAGHKSFLVRCDPASATPPRRVRGRKSVGPVRQIGYRRGKLRKHAMKPLCVLLALAVAAAATADGAVAFNSSPQ